MSSSLAAMFGNKTKLNDNVEEFVPTGAIVKTEEQFPDLGALDAPAKTTSKKQKKKKK